MNRTEQIESIAAKLKHNIEAMEAYGSIGTEKFNKGETGTISYKLIMERYYRASNNVQDLRYDLGELNARLTPDGILEIY